MTQRVSWKDKAVIFTSDQQRRSLVRQETIEDGAQQQDDRDRNNTGPSQRSFDSGIQNKSFSSSFGESFDTLKGPFGSKSDASARKASLILYSIQSAVHSFAETRFFAKQQVLSFRVE